MTRKKRTNPKYNRQRRALAQAPLAWRPHRAKQAEARRPIASGLVFVGVPVCVLHLKELVIEIIKQRLNEFAWEVVFPCLNAK